MTKLITIISAFIGIVVLAFGLSILFAFPAKWLWNSTMPELFAFKVIDVWMAWKLSFLCSILFKSSSIKTS